MPASSNFQQAIREAQSGSLVGPNVVNKALPYVGGVYEFLACQQKPTVLSE